MGRDRATRRKVAPGRREFGATSPGEQRSEEEHRPAKAAYERRVWFLFDDVGASDSEGGASHPFDLGAEIEEQARHHFDIADARYVGQHALVAREQARGKQRQGRVFVAFDFDRPGEALTAFDEQRRHMGVGR